LSRAKALRARAEARLGGKFNKNTVISFPITNAAVSYEVAVGVGGPATTEYSLLVDNSDPNTWIAGTTQAFQAGGGKDTGIMVTLPPDDTPCTIWDVTLTLPPATVSAASIGVTSSGSGFEGVDGVLGLGPPDFSVDNLTCLGPPLYSIQFAPTDTESNQNGEIILGGTDTTKFTGSISYVTRTTVSPASGYWGFAQTITYGTSSTKILPSTVGIVDTGTTLLLIASDAFARYNTATGAVADPTTGLQTITTTQFSSLQSLNFLINGITYEFTANAQIWPRALNTFIGGSSNKIYMIVGDIGTPSGEGLDFINGQVWLERFYAVFDTTNNRIGFATTPNTLSTIN